MEEDLARDSSRGLDGKLDITFMTILRELLEEHGDRGRRSCLSKLPQHIQGIRGRSAQQEAQGRPADASPLGGGSAAARQRELIQALQQRMDALESQVGGVDERVEELVKALQEELAVIREALKEQSEAIGLLERRTNRRDSRRGTEAAIAPEVAGTPAGPSYRVYRELVTWEPEDGEEDAYEMLLPWSWSGGVSVRKRWPAETQGAPSKLWSACENWRLR